MVRFSSFLVLLACSANAANRITPRTPVAHVPAALATSISNLPSDLGSLHQRGDNITIAMQGGTAEPERAVHAGIDAPELGPAEMRGLELSTPRAIIASANVPAPEIFPSVKARSRLLNAVMIMTILAASTVSWAVMIHAFSKAGFHVESHFTHGFRNDEENISPVE